MQIGSHRFRKGRSPVTMKWIMADERARIFRVGMEFGAGNAGRSVDAEVDFRRAYHAK